MMRWLLVTVLLLSPLSVFAKTKEFVREYTYIAGEADSKITVRKMAAAPKEILNRIKDLESNDQEKNEVKRTDK